MEKTIRYIRPDEFAKYGSVIRFDGNNAACFQIAVSESEATGWQKTVLNIIARSLSSFGRHPDSTKTFEPLAGTTLIHLSNSKTPEDYETFLLDQPICLHKSIWHATSSLSECSKVMIIEKSSVASVVYELKAASSQRTFVKNESIQPTQCEAGVTRKVLGMGGSLMLTEVLFAADAEGTIHVHPHEQVSYIANGSFEFTMDGKKQIIKRGDSVYIPSNLQHGALALEDNSIIVDVFTPQREDFLNDHQKI